MSRLEYHRTQQSGRYLSWKQDMKYKKKNTFHFSNQSKIPDIQTKRERRSNYVKKAYVPDFNAL